MEKPSLRIVHPPAEFSPSRRGIAPLDVQQKRQFFKSLVLGSLDCGFLRYSKRQELIQYAAKLGIGEFDACLLIAETQYHADEIEPLDAGDPVAQLSPVTPRFSIPMKVSLALATACLIDLLLIWAVL